MSGVLRLSLYLSDINLFFPDTFGHVKLDLDPEGMLYIRRVHTPTCPPQYHSIGYANGVILSLFFAIFRRVGHGFVLLLESRKMPKVIKVSFKVRRRFLPRRLDWNTYAFRETHGVDA